tara:strand:- start:71869 stop:73581 length:1713 start_codon:yes stop_codon:yes gene_type:complete
MSPKNMLQNILFEAQSYKEYEDIEKLVEKGMNLQNVPVQPLYISLQNATSDQVAQVLPKLSKEQRKCFLDLDLWKRDEVDVESFDHWIEVYTKCKEDSIVKEFVNSDEFLMYLKSRINIYTFDVEDPMYPDHDFYFLTDDNLLLIEYSQDYDFPQELKFLIRHFYDVHGVENAYSKLFKIINESFILREEELYQEKKERMRDFGFVDYYEAREKLFAFIGLKSMNKFIQEKKPVIAKVHSQHKNQSLHSSALVNFDKDIQSIMAELIKVSDTDKINYLHFSFVRLINSTITLNDALKGGRVELTKIGELTKTYLELGISYIKSIRQYAEDDSVFNDFDFFDVYKVGHTLISLRKSKIKKSISGTPFEKEDYEYFLGTWWNGFLENSFSSIPKVKAFGVGRHPQKVNRIETYEFWDKEISCFVALIPFVNKFFQTLHDLKTNGQLNDQFYLNYTVDNIDFESIMISSFISHELAQSQQQGKMGLTIIEFKEFIKKYFVKKGEEYNLLAFDQMLTPINTFARQFGLEVVPDFEVYLYGILSEHLSGYEFDTLEDEDFSHVGGPILLNTLAKH